MLLCNLDIGAAGRLVRAGVVQHRRLFRRQRRPHRSDAPLRRVQLVLSVVRPAHALVAPAPRRQACRSAAGTRLTRT